MCQNKEEKYGAWGKKMMGNVNRKIESNKMNEPD